MYPCVCLHATPFLWHTLQEPVQVVLVCPVGADKQVHFHLSLVRKLDRMFGRPFVVIVTTQYPAEKSVQLLDPRLESIWLAKYCVSIYV